MRPGFKVLRVFARILQVVVGVRLDVVLFAYNPISDLPFFLDSLESAIAILIQR